MFVPQFEYKKYSYLWSMVRPLPGVTEKNNSDYCDLGARPIDTMPNLLHATRVPKLAYSMTQYRLLVISQNNRVEAQLCVTL
jgi:hypothetical protein